MGNIIVIVVFQTRMLHLGCWILMLLPAYGDYDTFHEISRFPITINASQGDDVVLSCNESLDKKDDLVWRKNISLLYIQSLHKNQTVTNYTSSRMQVDPKNPSRLQISNVQLSDAGHYECFPKRQQWILNIKVRESRPLPLKEMLLYIVPSAAGLIAVCVIVFCTVWIYRKLKRKVAAGHRETEDEFQTHGRRVTRFQSSHYFEKFNSVYGEIQLNR